MKRRIEPWGHERRESIEMQPQRTSDFGILGMRYVQLLDPNVRYKWDDTFRSLVDVEVASQGSYSMQYEKEIAIERVCEKYAPGFEEVNSIKNKLVEEWQRLARAVDPETLTVFDESANFIVQLLGDYDIRDLLLRVKPGFFKSMVFSSFIDIYVEASLREDIRNIFDDINEDDEHELYDYLFENQKVTDEDLLLKCRVLDTYDFLAKQEEYEKIILENPDSFCDVDISELFFKYDILGWQLDIGQVIQHSFEVKRLGGECPEVLSGDQKNCVVCDERGVVDAVWEGIVEFARVLFDRTIGSSELEKDLIASCLINHVHHQEKELLEKRSRMLKKQAFERLDHVVDNLGSFVSRFSGILTEGEINLLHESIRLRSIYIRNHTQFFPCDIQETGMARFCGDYLSDGDQIRVSWDDSLAGFDQSTIDHELMHGLSGHGYVQDDAGAMHNISVGFDKYDFFTFLNESFTEYFVLMGNVEDADLLAGFEMNGSYVTARKLVHAILDHSKMDIERAMAYGVMAFFEDVGGDRSVWNFHEFSRVVGEVYGRRFLVQMQDCLNRFEYQLQKENWRASWLDAVDMMYKMYEESVARFGDDRFFQVYIGQGVYRQDYEKPLKKKTT